MRRVIILSAIAFVLISCAAAFADDENITEFSAVYVEKDGETTKTGNICVAKGMTRYDLSTGSEIMVIRYDRQLIWLIYPKLKRYIVEEYTAGQPVDPPKPQEGTFGDLTRKSLGFEEVDSYRMRKFLVTVKPNGKEENKYEYYEWYRDNFPVAVKTQSLVGESSMEYTKIKLGKPPIELFAEPRSYKRSTIEEIKAVMVGNANKSKQKHK
ncbi:MAG: hypothetical protein Q4F74_01765 [Synergistaceae bacterium]|nr:hypothetical protein [Synergistaceae bacterium]